jgi:hypothetical protein
MASGALPCPGRVPEQRLLSPKIRRWRRWSCRTVLGKTLIVLGFSVGRLFIGKGASSGGDQGGLTTGGRGHGLGRAPSWLGWPLALPLNNLYWFDKCYGGEPVLAHYPY